jgi:hypothetical protein
MRVKNEQFSRKAHTTSAEIDKLSMQILLLSFDRAYCLAGWRTDCWLEFSVYTNRLFRLARRFQERRRQKVWRDREHPGSTAFLGCFSPANQSPARNVQQKPEVIRKAGKNTAARGWRSVFTSAKPECLCDSMVLKRPAKRLRTRDERKAAADARIFTEARIVTER